MDAEAETWADGWAVRQEDGTLAWPDEEAKQFEARHHGLVRTAERLREMGARWRLRGCIAGAIVGDERKTKENESQMGRG